MMMDVETNGSHLDAACRWLMSNSSFWQSWLSYDEVEEVEDAGTTPYDEVEKVEDAGTTPSDEVEKVEDAGTTPHDEVEKVEDAGTAPYDEVERVAGTTPLSFLNPFVGISVFVWYYMSTV